MGKTANTIQSDTRYHNTVLLLQKYRNVLWSLKLETTKAERSFQTEFGKSIQEFLDDVYHAGAELKGTQIEERARSISRSQKMLKLIDGAVDMMRDTCQEGEEGYHILRLSYMEPKKMTNAEVMSGLQRYGIFLSERTLQRKRQEAIEVVSSILWGYSTRECLDILNHFVN